MFEDIVLKEFDLYKDNKLQIVRPSQGSLLVIKTTGGAKHPSLDGMFTAVGDAERAIRNYLNNHFEVPRTSKNVEDNVEEKIKTQKGKENKHAYEQEV